MYTLAIEISGSKLLAEEILVGTFIKVRLNKNLLPGDPDIFFQMIRALVCTSNEILLLKNCTGNFTMGRFYHTPVLCKLLFEQMDIITLCKEMKIERGALGKLIRGEVKGMLKDKFPGFQSIQNDN
jgi:uncharacterized protein YneF (UPF0154 family)